MCWIMFYTRVRGVCVCGREYFVILTPIQKPACAWCVWCVCV